MSDIINSGERPIKIVLRLAVPSVLEQVLLSLAGLIDTAMVGALGANATAAIGINAATVWLVQGLIMAVSISFMFMVARKIGEGRIEEAKQITREAITFSTLFGSFLAIVIFVLSPYLPIWLGGEGDVIPLADKYMRIVGISFLFLTITNVFSSIIRSAGNARMPLIVNAIANILNIIGNLFLINETIDFSFIGIDLVVKGAGLGVEGAALSTLFSRVVSAVIFIACVFVAKSPVQIKPKGNYKVSLYSLKTMVQIGIPTALERSSLNIGALVLTAMISKIGTVSIAANHLTNQIESILYLPAYGVAAAATTLVGQSIGAGRGDMANKFAWLCTIVNAIMIVSVCIPIFIFAEPIFRMFTPSEEVIQLGIITLRLAAAFEITFATFICVSGVCSGSGDVKTQLIVSTVGMWFVRLWLAYFIGIYLGGGLVAIWIAISADMTWRGISMFLRLKHKRWLPASLREMAMNDREKEKYRKKEAKRQAKRAEKQRAKELRKIG